jgi:hypothetical protein
MGRPTRASANIDDQTVPSIATATAHISLRRLTRVTDQLRGLADELADDYVHGRWRPEATEEHRARILSAQASVDGGLDGLAAGGVLTTASIEQMLRPHPAQESWRLAPVLHAYPGGSPEAQALVRDLLDAIAVTGFPLLPPRPLRYIEAPAPYNGTAPSLFSAPPPWSSTPAAPPIPAAGRTRNGNRSPGSTNTCAAPT